MNKLTKIQVNSKLILFAAAIMTFALLALVFAKSAYAAGGPNGPTGAYGPYGHNPVDTGLGSDEYSTFFTTASIGLYTIGSAFIANAKMLMSKSPLGN